MVALAIGRMGMGLETFLALTPDQFISAHNEFLKAENEKKEASELTQWQVARWQVWRTLCPPKLKKINQFNLIKLPGDEAIKKQIKKKRSRNRPERNPVRFKALKAKWG